MGLSSPKLIVIDSPDLSDIGAEFNKRAAELGRERLSPLHVTDTLADTIEDYVLGFKYIDKKAANSKDAFAIFVKATSSKSELEKVITAANCVMLDNNRDVFVLRYDGETPAHLLIELQKDPYWIKFASLHRHGLGTDPVVKDIDDGASNFFNVIGFPSLADLRPYRKDITVGGDKTHFVHVVNLDEFFPLGQNAQAVIAPKPAGLG